MMERVAYVSVPPAVEPFYTLARRNQSTVLFRGRVDVVGTSDLRRPRQGKERQAGRGRHRT